MMPRGLAQGEVAALRRVVRIAVLIGVLMAMVSWALTLLTSAFPGSWVGVLSAGLPLVGLLVLAWLGWRIGSGSGSAVWGAIGGILAGGLFALLTAAPELYLVAPTRILLTPEAKGVTVALTVLATALLSGMVALAGASVGANRHARRRPEPTDQGGPATEKGRRRDEAVH